MRFLTRSRRGVLITCVSLPSTDRDPSAGNASAGPAVGFGTAAPRRRARGRSIVFAFVAVLIGGSFLLPALAGLAVGVGSNLVGVRAERLEVVVDAWPPQVVALGRADRVRLSGTRVAYGEMAAASVDVTVRDLDILGARSGGLDASIVAATVEGIPITAIEAHGSSLVDTAFELRLSPMALITLAGRILAGEIDPVKLAEPDRLEVNVGSYLIAVRFHVDSVSIGLAGVTVSGTASVSVT